MAEAGDRRMTRSDLRRGCAAVLTGPEWLLMDKGLL